MIHCLHILSLSFSLSLSVSVPLTSQIIFVLSTVEWIDIFLLISTSLVARVKLETHKTPDTSVDGNSFMNVVGC
jgi:hypothetical protein